MNASRKFFSFAAILAVTLAISSALPTTNVSNAPTPILDPEDLDDSFFGFPFLSNLFAPLWKLFPTFSSVTPEIDIVDGKSVVTLKVTDYGKDDLKIKVKNNIMSIQGEHKSEEGNYAKSFFFSFSLGSENATTSEAKAELSSDGYLLVTVPLNGAPENPSEEVIVPITETGRAYVPPPKRETPQAAETPAVSNDNDRKEETTVKNIEDNEVVPSLA